jgi:hypothetical protein
MSRKNHTQNHAHLSLDLLNNLPTSHWPISEKGLGFRVIFKWFYYCNFQNTNHIISHFLKLSSSDSGFMQTNSIKSPCLHPVFGPPFTPYPPLSVVSTK